MFFLICYIEFPKWYEKSEKEKTNETDHNNIIGSCSSNLELDLFINDTRYFVELRINLL